MLILYAYSLDQAHSDDVIVDKLVTFDLINMVGAWHFSNISCCFCRIRRQHTTTKVGAMGSTTTRERKNNIMEGFCVDFSCSVYDPWTCRHSVKSAHCNVGLAESQLMDSCLSVCVKCCVHLAAHAVSGHSAQSSTGLK